jgi:hypothetical protein
MNICANLIVVDLSSYSEEFESPHKDESLSKIRIQLVEASLAGWIFASWPLVLLALVSPCPLSSWAFLGPGRASGWPEKSPTGNPWPEPGPARPTFSKFWPEPGPRPEKARFFPGWPDGPARSNGNFLFSVARARPDIITG